MLSVCVTLLLELLCPQANKNVSITAVKNVGSNLLLITIVVVLCRPLNLPLTFVFLQWCACEAASCPLALKPLIIKEFSSYYSAFFFATFFFVNNVNLWINQTGSKGSFPSRQG
jgi:hypothetical protein